MSDILTYHRLIYRRAFKEARAFFGYSRQNLFVALITTLIVGAIVYVVSGLSAMHEAWTIPVLVGLGAGLIFFIAVFLDKLILIPVSIYKELGGSEGVRLTIIPELPTPNVAGWITLKLYNRSPLDVLGCYVELMQVTKESDADYKFGQSIGLLWSSQNPPRKGRKDIAPGDHYKFDLVVSVQGKNLMDFEVQDGSEHYRTGVGKYKATLMFRGAYDKTSFTCEFELSFAFDGGTKFTCDLEGAEIMLNKLGEF